MTLSSKHFFFSKQESIWSGLERSENNACDPYPAPTPAPNPTPHNKKYVNPFRFIQLEFFGHLSVTIFRSCVLCLKMR